MINRHSNLLIPEKLLKMKAQMGGVFSTADLFHVIAAPSRLTNMRKIKKMVEAGILTHCCREYYVTSDFDLWTLATRLVPKGYISLDSILAKRQLVGTGSDSHVSVVAVHSPHKVLTVQGKTLTVYSIAQNLFFGFASTPACTVEADTEKAFLDLLYYYNRGHRFTFDPLVEVRLNKLNFKKLRLYLKKYQNPKFVKFVQGVIHEY